MKHYIVTIFDSNENKRINYYTKGLISSEEIDQYMGMFSFLLNRDGGTDCLYLLGEDDVVYRIYIDDIISIEVKNDEND